MEIKASYKNRKIDGLFSYYPVAPLRYTDTIKKGISDWLLNHSAKLVAKSLNESLPPAVELNTMVGIEVEAENVTAPFIAGIPLWSCVQDSSLRNNGREFITAPLAPEVARDALITLFAGFKKVPVDFSWRTSIHFHLNLRNDKVQQLLSLLLLYTLFEDSLFGFVGDLRKQSNFCVPVQETNMSAEISNVLNGREHIPGLCHEWSKYTALNIRPLCYNDHAGTPLGGNQSSNSGKGTIEFRHLEGTADIAKVLNWMNLILCLQRAARDMSLDDLEERILNIHTREQYIAMLRDVFQDHAALLPVRGFQQILYSSVAYAKECFCPIPDVGQLVKISHGKTTGLSEMIKIRSRHKPVMDEKKKEESKMTSPPAGAWISNQWHMPQSTPWETVFQNALAQVVPPPPFLPLQVWAGLHTHAWPGHSPFLWDSNSSGHAHGLINIDCSCIFNALQNRWESLT